MPNTLAPKQMSKRPSSRATRYQLVPVAQRPERPLLLSFSISLLLTLPLLALLYLLNQWLAVPFLPADFFAWAVGRLSGLVRTAGFLLTTAAALALDVGIGDALVSVGEVTVVVLFVLAGGIIGVFYALLARLRIVKFGWFSGLFIGLLCGIGVTFVSRGSNSTSPNSTSAILAYGGAIALFALWGALVGWANAQAQRRRVDLAPLSRANSTSAPASQYTLPVTRRRFFVQLAAGALTVTLLGGSAAMQFARWRRQQRPAVPATVFANPESFPPSLKVRLYPTTGQFQFPEFDRPRYQPQTHPIGVCFSGGGPRSTTASVGQMRGLHALGVLDRVGAISCVSGGAWFGTIFCYAAPSVSDSTLLGAVVEPGAITLESLAQLDPQYSAAPFANLSTERLGSVKTELMVEIGRMSSPPFNRLYSRTLNEFLLKPFGLDDPHKFFTLDQAALTAIMTNNPALQPEDFYTVRPDRPYLIVGAVQAYPLGENQRARSVEITPLYAGLPQYFPGAGEGGLDIGGGYIESFAFDSSAPVASEGGNIVQVATPNPPFLLSDVLGTTSSAPGALFNSFGQPEWFPKFNYWSPVQPPTIGSPAATATYSFIDGALLENIAIVPLLRRQYPIIVAFVNVVTALGADDPINVAGINVTITNLFGVTPASQRSFEQDTQIFPSQQFQPLLDGLLRAKREGRGLWFADSYEIVQPNIFGIPPYPGDGKVHVIWFYNDLNQGWHDQLPPEVQALLASSDPTNDLHNFPHYDTFAQNKSAAGLPEMLYLSPPQINLMAHMWCYTVMHDAGAILQSLGR